MCHRASFLLLLSTIAAASPDFTLRLASIGPFEQLTPASADATSLLLGDLVYESLLTPDDSGELTPRLAGAWELCPNGTVYIELDTTRHFSDGSPVTLRDVADSLSAVGLRSSPRDSGLEVTPGADRVRPEIALLRARIFKTTPNGILGTGAFAVVRQDRDEIELQRRFPAPHRINHVIVVAYSTPAEVLKALARGDCNGAVGVSATAVELFFAYMNQFQVLPIPQIYRQALVFNRNMLSAKDRDVLFPALQSSGLATIVPGYSVPVPAMPVSLGNGERVPVLTWNADWAHQRLALAVRHILDRRGGEVRSLSPPDATKAFFRGEFGIAICPIPVWPESESLSHWRTGGPFSATGYSNPALDAAVDAGDWQAARRAFDLDPPGVFLQEWTTFAVLDSRIFNPTFGRYQRFETLPDWEVP